MSGSESRDDDTFLSRYGPWALVAGASDGIGESFARDLARRGVNVVLVARRDAVLESVAARLRADFGIETRVVVADLTSPDLGATIAAATGDLEIGLLVYNAGAVHGATGFLDQPLANTLALVDLNCRGPMTLVHRLGSAMRARGRGGILLVTSVSALAGASYTATYNATKSFDLIFAESLWHELAPLGIDVTAAIVGATRTPSMLQSTSGFANYPGIMEPDEVAQGALAALGRGPAWVAGKQNRERVNGLFPLPRTQIINGMSRAVSEIYGLPFVPVVGTELADLD
jgi:short-subunit dehydrogenase